MSHQHFYSRVPSRVSLFKKIDGFDTFAHSSSLDKNTIDELSVLYADKLEIHDPVKVRRGEIPCVYSQTQLPSGRVAQTVISYINKDFTGERSAYLAHSLVLTGEERKQLFFSNEVSFFNPSLFVTDISAFNLTARDAVGNNNVPEACYFTQFLTGCNSVISEYDSDMIKSFIYSVISAIIGEGKDVYFRLPYEDGLLSEKALEFINALMILLPYSIRERLSFVSFVSRVDAYPGFKLKCVGGDCPGVAANKGVFYDFSTGEITGQAEEYNTNRSMTYFVYSLLEYPKIRDEFHLFVEGIVEKYSDLSLDVKSFGEIVFLFWQCSGFYVEESYLQNDESISLFLDIYAKFRDGLNENHRVRAYRPLARYSKEQIAIPDGVYTRLSRLYPSECVSAKAVALDVILSLIHIDIMRERLFNFISRNYNSEIDKVKEVINLNLCRVFYGGFLQARILRLFDTHFESEPANTRDLIIDKLLLSIRTPDIQRHIVAFLEKHYRGLTAEQKLKICSTCLEMMPECDDLSVLLVGLINRRIAFDRIDITGMMSQKLTEMLDVSIKAGDMRLVNIFVNNPGFCEDVALKHILVKGDGVDYLIDLLASMSLHKRATKLIRAYNVVPELAGKGYTNLLDRFSQIQVSVQPSTLYDVIQVDKIVGLSLLNGPASELRENIIYPLAPYTFYDVFKFKLGADGIDALMKYAEDKPVLLESRQYQVVIDVVRMIELCGDEDTEGVFKIAVSLPDVANLRSDIADYLKNKCLDPYAQSELTVCIYRLLIDYLDEGRFDFEEIYNEYKSHYEEIRREERSVRSIVEPADRLGAADATSLVLSCASSICDASGELAEIVIDSGSGLREALSEFISFYGIGAAIFLKRRTSESHFGITDIIDELIDDRNSSIRSVDDALDIILRRK